MKLVFVPGLFVIVVVVAVPLVVGLSDNVLKNISANLVNAAARKAGFSDSGREQMLGFVEKVRLEASDEFSEAAALERAVQACDMFRKSAGSDDVDKLTAFQQAFESGLKDALKGIGR